jgi:hypothetical protein
LEYLHRISAEKKRQNGNENTVGRIPTYVLADRLELYFLKK